jgi:cytochrome c553
MTIKQLKELLAQIEALKSADRSTEFNAGVDAAAAIVNGIVQEALDRDKIQKLEAELAELRSKYPDTVPNAPKRRGRRPKALTV